MTSRLLPAYSGGTRSPHMRCPSLSVQHWIFLAWAAPGAAQTAAITAAIASANLIELAPKKPLGNGDSSLRRNAVLRLNPVLRLIFPDGLDRRRRQAFALEEFQHFPDVDERDDLDPLFALHLGHGRCAVRALLL